MRTRSPFTFFVLVFALAVPFWMLGAVTTVQLLPGLPLSSLMIVCPLLAAAILVYRESKTPGVIALSKRSFDFSRIGPRSWYVPIVLLMPGVMILTYGVMRLVGLPLPALQFPILAAPVMLVAFFLAALGEELGWSGYAIDPMQERWGALRASTVLGVVTVAWHLVPLVQANRTLPWIAGWSLNAVALRVLTVWIYNGTGKSVFAAALFHSMVNLSTFLFPNYGSHWDPRISGPITAGVAALVTVAWGPSTLARYGRG
jgi:uncharacterized protein